jgi:amino acid transporter
LAFVFGRVGLDWIEKIVAVSAIFAMGSVFLVFQIGQPRIWMSMSRDGLLPQKFSALHPRYKTPAFSSLVAGFLVAIPSLFMNLTEVTDLCSIGTLFAFALVSGGVLLLEKDSNTTGFKVPYVNGQFIVPILCALTTWAFIIYKPEILNFGKDTILYWAFLAVFAVVSVYSFLRHWSLIPVMGLMINFYLMTELGILNWSRFLLWCAIGIIIYFLYGYRHSKLSDPRH